MAQTIQITCQGADVLPLDKLEVFQGDLKSLSKKNYAKLKNQILEVGFSAPIFVWEHKGHHYILDGTQRTRTLLKMQKEGFDIPELPIVWIDAKDMREARVKLLSIASQYGEVESQGLYEFLHEADISFEELDLSFQLPEIDFDKFKFEFFKDLPPNPQFDGTTIHDNVDDSEDESTTALQGSLICYYGGKQKMAHRIIPLIPKHTVYVEPYAGGAALLFAKPWPNVNDKQNYKEIINDTSKDLINMYRIFQTRFDEIQNLLVHTLYSEEEYRKSKAILRREITADELWLAWAYYVSIQQGFSNVLSSGWGRSVFGRNHAATWISKISKLDDYRERMSSMHISCTDAIDCIKQFDSPQTFFYCDPPYPGTDQGHYEGFSEKDFQNLCNTLNEIQGSFILSNYDQPYLKNTSWERHEFKTQCLNAPTEKKDRIEIIWKQKSRVPVREEIQKLYDSGAYDCFTG